MYFQKLQDCNQQGQKQFINPHHILEERAKNNNFFLSIPSKQVSYFMERTNDFLMNSTILTSSLKQSDSHSTAETIRQSLYSGTTS